MKIKTLLMMATLIVWLCGHSGLAKATSLKAVNIEATMATASRELKLPPELIKAIAKVESGLNPWALNIAGKGFVFDTKEEAIQKAREAQASGRSFDIGVMQINQWWLNRYQISLEAAFDPVVNIYLGAWILKQEFTRYGSTHKAVGAYHSPNTSRAKRYARKVMATLNQEVSLNQDSSVASLISEVPKSKKQDKIPATPNPKLVPAPEHRGAGKPVSMKVPSTAAELSHSMKIEAR